MIHNQKTQVAFLIDADNLSAPAVQQAFEHLDRGGAMVTVRRAYGGHEALAGMKETLKRFAVRRFVNQGRGTTDVALTVDAMDLLHADALPATVAIGSSDADFAPLALRLRETGRRVLCLGQRDKAAVEALELVYDEVHCFAANHQSEAAAPAAVLPAASRARPARTAKSAVKAAKATDVDHAAAVHEILELFPEWLPGEEKQLNQMGTPLRESGISKGSRPLHELFRKHPGYFKVLPSTGPAKQVRLLTMP